MSIMKLLALSALSMLLASQASAQDPNTVRVGLYFVHYDATGPNLSGPFTPAGVNFKIDSLTTLYLAYLRTLTANLSLELAAGVPPNTKTVATGPATVGSVPLSGQNVANARWFSPTLLLDYTFFDPNTLVRPYLGAGVNYTKFYDRVSTASGDAANGGPTSFTLSDSWGPAATAGLNFRLGGHFSAIVSYSYAQVKSNYVSNTGGIIRTTTLNYNPTTWVVALGYSF
jgi:outer membrane protein